MKNHITVRERGARQWGTSTNKEKNIRKFEEEEATALTMDLCYPFS